MNIKALLIGLVFAFVVNSSYAQGAMLDADGKVIDKDYSTIDLRQKTDHYAIADVTRHCEFKGYFIYDSTIFMCVKIREGVTTEELIAYNKADRKLQNKKRIARDKWYKEWIKTDEGKEWEVNYRKKLNIK